MGECMRLNTGNIRGSGFNQRYYGEKTKKCMMCSAEFEPLGNDFYSKNFCSEDCRKRYFSPV